MLGLMMDRPLLITDIMRHAERIHGNTEIVSITADEPLHRYTYAECFKRVRKLGNALAALGVKSGDLVATLAWNDFRHFECYYAISCSGAVLHTLNPRLFEEQLVYIINHAGDRWIFIDPIFVPKLELVQEKLNVVQGYIIMADEAHMPATTLKNARCYETLLATETDEFNWPDLDERSASALCYTSGTTGNPKGVLYNHRSTVLHAYAGALPDSMAISRRDTILPVVPMFHANAWGVCYSAPMVGSKLIFPGPKLGDGETLQHLIESEEVTVAMGVPTVWLTLLNYLEESGKRVDSMKRTIVGGSACPGAMMETFRDKYDVYTHHAWGMTEMSPLGTFNTAPLGYERMTNEEILTHQIPQGSAVAGVELKIVDDKNQELPWDGVVFGNLKVRGSWVCSGYFKLEGESAAHDDDGWFDTGDVCSIDPSGNMRITDRTKDVIKSGGEWISSIELENTAVAHPKVAEAAVIGVYHPKWGERPLLVVVRKVGEDPSKEELLHWFDGRVARWWYPDDVVFINQLPHTATGKLDKVQIRQQFDTYTFPNVEKLDQG